ncbi:MAG: ABC transporter permease subunit [Phycisphaerales bacterium]
MRFWDRVARAVITAGGVGVLAAMLGICVFLFASAAPLFASGSGRPVAEVNAAQPSLADALLIERGVREGSILVLARDGVLREIALIDGRTLASLDLRLEGEAPTAATLETASGRVTLLFPGERLETAEIEQVDLLLDPELAARRWGGLEVGRRAPLDDASRRQLGEALHLTRDLTEQATVVRRSEGTWAIADLRRNSLDTTTLHVLGELAPEIHAAAKSDRERFLVGRTSDGGVWFAQSRRVTRLGGGGASERVTAGAIEFEPPEGAGMPLGAFITIDGPGVLVVWADGRFQRYDASAGVREPIHLIESGRVIDEGRHVTLARMGLGSRTLLVGDDAGVLSAWLLVDDPKSKAADGRRLAPAHRYDIGEGSITSIGLGPRDRTVAIGTANGAVELRNVTSGKRVARFESDGRRIAHAVLAPAIDGVVAIDQKGGVRAWAVEPGHPEATWSTLFGRVLYEGYQRPRWVYQSTGSPGVEPKLSLTPLVWGTLKATALAMLIATPIAVLGAIFSSEFLHPRARRSVKPTIELMASLPSVVLGFVAAMLVAPFVRDWLPTILVAFGVVPVVVMGCAHAWRLLPRDFGRRSISRRPLVLVILALALALGLSVLAGPLLERTLFAPGQGETGPASIRRWLDGAYGGAFPGWLVVLMAPAAVLVMVVNARFVSRVWSERMARTPRLTAGGLELGRFMFSTGLSLLLAAAGAGLITWLGYDTRDSVFGPFSQRNTLVVGLVMGFAVIPIIYTISDDAMRSVPDSLRSASLGAGATKWQTAVRVVLPVAGSGIFSACMIGLGRAVGETMIVLMATGNTPEMDLNIFSGFRTLAANIAVELPEAPRGATHYRVLFLCGLVLFLMTMVINTLAELVRQSYRRRSAAL